MGVVRIFSIIKWCCWSLLLAPLWVYAGPTEEIKSQLTQRLKTGEAQNVIVVLHDDEAEVLNRVEVPLAGGEAQWQKKLARYAAKKQRLFSNLYGGQIELKKSYSHLPVALVRLPSTSALNELLANPDVAGVFPDKRNYPSLVQSLPLIQQPQAASLGYAGAGTTIAVLDTGVDYTRSTFGTCSAPNTPGCKIALSIDIAHDDLAMDSHGHGTNVAGIVAGVAPGARIAALDVFDGESAWDSDVIAGINWAIRNKATYNIVAINLSLGDGIKYTQPLLKDSYKPAIDQARAAGILTVAAAGNEKFLDGLGSPAAIEGVISVGAVYDSNLGPVRCDTATAADRVSCFSNSASFLTLLAPGSSISAAGIAMSGTSQASPHVAGAVAVLRAAHPQESLAQTVTRLTSGPLVTDNRNGIVKPRLDLLVGLGQASSKTAATPNASVIEFYNTDLKHYFLTASQEEAAGIDIGKAGPGWVRTGYGFKAWTQTANPPAQSVEVCRFYGRGPNSHFYAVAGAECELVKKDLGWEFEAGTQFYLYAPSNGACPQDTQPIYRAYNNRFFANDSNHRYTANTAIYQSMASMGWLLEGVAMCAPL